MFTLPRLIQQSISDQSLNSVVYEVFILVAIL
jgi:hypothetical protein